ncbi:MULTISPECIES: hypothetical protein [Cyanophyceae]|nr:hypothetical protein [Coleofasciculus sp. FACHB-125]
MWKHSSCLEVFGGFQLNEGRIAGKQTRPQYILYSEGYRYLRR